MLGQKTWGKRHRTAAIGRKMQPEQSQEAPVICQVCCSSTVHPLAISWTAASLEGLDAGR